MLKVLVDALVDTGASGIQLHLRPSEDGNVCAIIRMERGNGEVKNAKLKSALAQPLVLQCPLGEIEEKLPIETAKFIESYAPSLALSNVAELGSVHTEGQASANKKETKKAQSEKSKTTVEPKVTKAEKVEDDDDSGAWT